MLLFLVFTGPRLVNARIISRERMPETPNNYFPHSLFKMDTNQCYPAASLQRSNSTDNGEMLVPHRHPISTYTHTGDHAMPLTILHQRRISGTFINSVLGLFLHAPVFSILRFTIMPGDKKRKEKKILSVSIKSCHIGNQNNIKALGKIQRKKGVFKN